MVKNVIYAIGNISFYSDEFKEEIKGFIAGFATALELKNDNIMENTVSTLSNLVRHSNAYVNDIMQNGIIKRVIHLIGESRNPKTLQFSLNFVLKAVQHVEVVEAYRDPILRTLKGINCGDPEVAKRVSKIQ